MLIDLGSPVELLLVGGTVGRVPRDVGEDELLARATAGAEAWARERAQERRRAHLSEQLMQFSYTLNAARTLTEVHDALLAFAIDMVGAYTAFLCVEEAGGCNARIVGGPRFPRHMEGLAVRWRPEFTRTAITPAAEARFGTGAPLSELGPVFVQTGAALVPRLPAWSGAALFLVERRESRQFNAGDWQLLQALVRQAEVAIERVRLFEEVRMLSLTDPLTGLGNRRMMDVVFEQAMGAAQRGGRLSVAMLDVDDFKEINDRDGHPAGDRVLQKVGAVLSEQLRGADVAIRFGGDEFLLILPDAQVAGADALVNRIQSCLPPGLRISAGTAEYHPSMAAANDLIDAADRVLYQQKRSRVS
jgi:diguanylate cyclase (GGDEF)-like protein